MIHSSPCGAPIPRTRAGVAALLAASVTTLAACHAPAQRAAPPAAAPPPVTYDWHDLLIVPLGSVLKDIPLKLHEVLLFRDEARGEGAQGAAPADSIAADAECYAADAPAPKFLGRAPQEYLLCFKQDRLSRIQASVRLPPDQAPGVFAAACAQWLKNPAAPAGAVCEGRDGPTHFAFRLEEEPGQAEAPARDQELSIFLDGAPDTPAVRP
jgi:hypothetical protein